jgi:dimethylsulfone monooxygenase
LGPGQGWFRNGEFTPTNDVERMVLATSTQAQIDESRAHLPIYDSANKLKLGTFGTNASYGMTASEYPTSYKATWEHTVGLAKQAEEIGFDMVVPVGRWRGFGGSTDFNGECFETLTWAAGVAEATERIMVFATCHVPTVHPIRAAKEAVTVDHISGGRFALNIVMGWFGPEMDMFGGSQREHDERYRVGEEWLTIIRKLWTEDEPFDFDGEFFTILDAEAWPKPIQKPHPVIMNAGGSPAGSDFSVRNADVCFVGFEDLGAGADLVKTFKRNALEKYKREVQVYTGAYIVCRDSEEEAREVHRRILDAGDREGVRRLMEVLGIQSNSWDGVLADQKAAEERFIAGWGTMNFVGTPEQVAQQFVDMYEAGIEGLTIGFLDYAEEMKFFDERVTPMLREAGLRA